MYILVVSNPQALVLTLGSQQAYQFCLLVIFLNNHSCCLVTKGSQTLCDATDCSPPGSSVHGISQARILEWVAISYSKGRHYCAQFSEGNVKGKEVL